MLSEYRVALTPREQYELIHREQQLSRALRIMVERADGKHDRPVAAWIRRLLR